MPKNEIEPLRAWGDWEVMPDCSLRNRKRRMEIYPEQLTQPELLISVYANRVVTDHDWNHFMPAFFFACRTAGIQEIPNVKTDFV